MGPCNPLTFSGSALHTRVGRTTNTNSDNEHEIPVPGSDMNDGVDRVSCACNNCWFTKGGA